ncbi:hypothetical protein PC115_g24487, partial [Phytophthora cactorum]
ETTNCTAIPQAHLLHFEMPRR